jgi:hypothetical protein
MAKWAVRVRAQSIDGVFQLYAPDGGGLLGGGQQLSWPNQCACCGGFPDDRLKIAYVESFYRGNATETHTHSWQIPYCSECRGHDRKHRAGITVLCLIPLYALFTFWGLSGGLWVLGGSPWTFAGIGIAAMVISAPLGYFLLKKAKSSMKATCPGFGKPAKYTKREGNIHTFYFKNRVYGEAFARANGVRPEIL